MHGSHRCKMHGGASLKGADNPAFKTGRYSKYAPQQIAEKIEEFASDDPLDLLPELQAQRALFAQYLSRFVPGTALTRDDIAALMSWTSEIGKQAERIMKMRNDSALTAAEIMYLQTRIVDVVVKYIDDPERRRAFINELFSGIASEPATATKPLQLTGSARS